MTKALWRLGVVTALLALGAPKPARAEVVYGAVIAENARKIGEGRYRAIKDWDRTLSFYSRVYPQNKKAYVWTEVASNPKVKALHIANVTKDRTWEGINLYQTGGKVYIYVIPAKQVPGAKPEKKKARKSRGKKGRKRSRR